MNPQSPEPSIREPSKRKPSWLEKQRVKLVGLPSRALTGFGDFKVEGLENLKAIPDGRPAVIAVGHRTDNDPPLAMSKIGREIPTVTAVQSVHFSPKHQNYLGEKLTGGKKKYLSVSYAQRSDGTNVATSFNRNDFSPMVQELDRGNNVLIAAHNPNQGDKPKPGHGAAYTASLAKAPVAPVFVEYTPHGDSKWRKDVTVRIGEHFDLPDHEDLSALSDLMDKQRRREPLSSAELEILRRQIQVLRDLGGIVLNAVEALKSDG
jgi:1-acyl-sn-glycerol-3-phosphate acyltransferase